MIDTHSHIIWGLDDGSPDEECSLEMAMIAVSSGITDIIATPHCIPGNFENYCGSDFDAAFDAFRAMLEKEQLSRKLRIHKGMEVYICDSTPEDYDSGRICCLADSSYMLIECDFSEDPWYLRDIVLALRERKVNPIIAHPERYYFAQDSTRYLYDLIDLGCALQLDTASIIGDFGSDCRRVALELLSNSAAQLAASDAHDTSYRTPDMRRAADFVARHFSPNYASLLFFDNPRNIIDGRRLLFRGQTSSGQRSKPSSRFMTDEEYWGV